MTHFLHLKALFCAIFDVFRCKKRARAAQPEFRPLIRGIRLHFRTKIPDEIESLLCLKNRIGIFSYNGISHKYHICIRPNGNMIFYFLSV